MLLSRSICQQICFLLFAITLSSCQNYEGDYNAEAEGADSTDFAEEAEDEKLDYSKYYSVDNSAPLLGVQASADTDSRGFVPPFQFTSYFDGPSSPIEFGASNQEPTKQAIKNPFEKDEKQVLGFINVKEEFPEFHASGSIPKDYFEKAQKKPSNEKPEATEHSYSSKPGPSYISHKLPAKYSNPKPEYSNQKEKFTKPKSYKDYKPAASKEYKVPDYSAKYAEYMKGKSSSSVSQFPQASGQNEKYSKSPATDSTPYQKYSFQPVADYGAKPKYLESLISTAAPYNPSYNKIAEKAPAFESQPSENVPKHLEGKNCKLVKKQIENPNEDTGEVKMEGMNCYVCEDPATSSKFTQCSYDGQPSETKRLEKKTETYSLPEKDPYGYRYKRYSGEDYNTDPYEFIKSRSLASYPKDDDESEAESYNEEYKYVPEDYYAGPSEKSISEQQSEEIAKNPANCVKKDKNGMTCMVCKDAKSGGNYETCSYTSSPTEEKYAYSTEKKYDSNEEPAEESAQKPVVNTKSPKSEEKQEKSPSYSKKSSSKPKSKESQKGFDPKAGKQMLIEDNPYEIPHHFAESTAKEQKTGPRGLDVSLYGGVDSSESKSSPYSSLDSAESTESSSKSPYSNKSPYGGSSNTKSPYAEIEDEYHFKLFPEYSNQESQHTEILETNPASEASRKDVAEVLAEFSKKDRSACKKAEKNGMTCYLCQDQKGIQHEECMYVSESKPKATHVAYHELQQIKSPESDTLKTEQTPAASNTEKTVVTSTQLPFPVGQMVAAASEGTETRVKYNKPKKNRRKSSKKSKKSKEQKAEASEVDSDKLSDDGEPPIKFAIDDEDGLYSEETKPVYSKTLGVKLPRYMIEKSEFEKEFDEFAGEQ